MDLCCELKQVRSDTSVAPSKRSLSTTLTRLNGGMTFQQVLSSQEPETPWHLHSTCMLWRMAWGQKDSEHSVRGAYSLCSQRLQSCNKRCTEGVQKSYQPFDQPHCYEDSLVGVLQTAPWLVLGHPQMFVKKPHHRTGCHYTLTTGNLLCIREINYTTTSICIHYCSYCRINHISGISTCIAIYMALLSVDKLTVQTFSLWQVRGSQLIYIHIY